MTRDELHALSTRIDAAIGSDRDLDEDIVNVFGKRPNGIPVCAGYIGIGGFTGNVQAAIRLAESVLPVSKAFAKGSPPSSGWKINLYRGMTPTSEPYASWECCIRPHAGAEKWHNAPTPALAVLLALVSALIALAPSPQEAEAPTTQKGEA